MGQTDRSLTILLLLICMFASSLYSTVEINADHPYIQYFGRWDFSDPLSPSHSWPGVYIYAVFEGTSIGVKLNDNYVYYNVFIDDQLYSIFKGNKSGTASYTLASGLADTIHTILFTKRCETTWTKFSFHGFILDDGKSLLPPPEKTVRKIEFIGDSYTSASGNEYTEPGQPPDGDAQYTNIYEGFGPITARNYGAQYHMTSLSGWGLVLDWTGSFANNIPGIFDQTHLYTEDPEWDFQNWIPNLVVIGLGLNDYSGFGGYEEGVAPDETVLYKSRYHEFIQRIRDNYPGVKILAVAAHIDWMQQTISEVVTEENNNGNHDVFYTFYPYYEGGYVNNGHPNVETHHKIAERLIATIDTIDAWEPYQDILPPYFTKLPESPFTVYGTLCNLKVKTNSYATVRFSTEDKSYDEMENEFTITGQREHSVSIPCVHNQQYTYYLRAADLSNNAMDTSAVITFSVDTTKHIQRWYDSNFDDTAWKLGSAPLGFGNNGNEATEIAQVQTAYFRHWFQLDDATSLTRMSAILKYDNGGVVYVNGSEIGRTNMPDSEIDYNTDASTDVSGNTVFSFDEDDLTLLKNGLNLITVEIHQNSMDNSDLIFDLKLRSSDTYIDYGSEWKYDDSGNEPKDQLISSGVRPFVESSPQKYRLHQNYPNPFNPITTISFDLFEKGHTTLTVFDLLGRKLKILVDKELKSGTYQFEFDGSTLPSGDYFYQIKFEAYSENKKFILLK